MFILLVVYSVYWLFCLLVILFIAYFYINVFEDKSGYNFIYSFKHRFHTQTTIAFANTYTEKRSLLCATVGLYTAHCTGFACKLGSIGPPYQWLDTGIHRNRPRLSYQ